MLARRAVARAANVALPMQVLAQAVSRRRAKQLVVQLEQCRRNSGVVGQGGSSSVAGKKSIFDEEQRGWDHIFEDIDTASKDLIRNSSSTRKPKHTRISLTAGEVNVFGSMFDAVFSADAHPESHVGGPAGVEKGQSPRVSDLALQLRDKSDKVKWTSEADQELDRKKEEMDLCNTDQQLLEWAMREVFGQFRSRESTAISTSAQQDKEGLADLPLPIYSRLIAALMETFRDKYADPYLALSVFEHARHLSTASYVFGCTTPAYNQLIETRWRCFRDLRGVRDALEEMRVNGIGMDIRTRTLSEMVRREVGERNLWEEETSVGSGEVWEMVGRIDDLTAVLPSKDRTRDARKRWSPVAEPWKAEALLAAHP